MHAPGYQGYDQQSTTIAQNCGQQQPTTEQGYGQQSGSIQNYAQQTSTLSGYDTSQYDPSQGYSYVQTAGYPSPYTPSAIDQYYGSQTDAGSYPGSTLLKNKQTYEKSLIH